MRIVLTGGGTAGHVTPLLAVASELERLEPETQLVYIGQSRDHRFDGLLDKTNFYARRSVMAGKWRRYHGTGLWAHLKDWRTIAFNIRDLLYFTIGFLQSIGYLIIYRPQLVFVKGGYVGLPVGLASAMLRIPVVTHDSDALPGLTNRVLSRFAKKSAVGMPREIYRSYKASHIVETGNPVRPEFFSLCDPTVYRKKLNVRTRYAVLVFGGSLGAQRLNKAVLAGLDTLLSKDDVSLLWITGRLDDVYIQNATARHPESRRVITTSFTSEIESYIGASDVIVSRAGASSIAEIAAAQKAAIFVPNPYLTGGHQTKNAQLLSKHNAAICVPEDQADDQLMHEVVGLLEDSAKRAQLSENIAHLAHRDAAVKLAQLILSEARAK